MRFSSELKSLLSDIEVDTKYLNLHKKIAQAQKNLELLPLNNKWFAMTVKVQMTLIVESQNTIIGTFNKIVKDYEVILLSDYGKGVLTNQLTQSLIDIAKKYNKKILS